MGPNSIVALGVIPRKQIDPVFNSQQGFRCRRVARIPRPEKVSTPREELVQISSAWSPYRLSNPSTVPVPSHRREKSTGKALGLWSCQCLRQYCTPTRNHLHRYYSHDAQRIGVVTPCIPGLKDLYLRLSECSITGAKKRLLVRATRQALLSRRNKWTVEAIPSNKQIPEFRAKRWMAPVMRDLSCTA